MTNQCIRVLLIEDDEDDFLLVRDLLSEVASTTYHLDWTPDYVAATRSPSRNKYDVYLVDYHLCGMSGLDILREMKSAGLTEPIIMLTGQGAYEVDLEAMKAGAADYLIKGQINAPLLERSIRYAIERKNTEKQLRHLSSKLLTIQEDERKRIASELHDSIGQSIAGIKFGIENALSLLEQGDPVSIGKSLRAVIPIIQNLIDEVRNIYMDLRPSILDDLGIIATIDWFCRQLQSVYPEIFIEKTVDITEEEIPEPLKIIIFRIMQESFNNIAKYSESRHVELTLLKGEGCIELTIQDNGIGFDLDAILCANDGRTGHGLASMKERVELANGTFSIGSVIGKGTKVQASWPFAAQ